MIEMHWVWYTERGSERKREEERKEGSRARNTFHTNTFSFFRWSVSLSLPSPFSPFSPLYFFVRYVSSSVYPHTSLYRQVLSTGRDEKKERERERGRRGEVFFQVLHTFHTRPSFFPHLCRLFPAVSISYAFSSVISKSCE